MVCNNRATNINDLPLILMKYRVFQLILWLGSMVWFPAGTQDNTIFHGENQWFLGQIFHWLDDQHTTISGQNMDEWKSEIISLAKPWKWTPPGMAMRCCGSISIPAALMSTVSVSSTPISKKGATSSAYFHQYKKQSQESHRTSLDMFYKLHVVGP